MDHYLRFTNGVQALRRKSAALSTGLGGALGIAADPLPHQMATLKRVLGDTHVRHLLSDEVGLGKTVQALMIVNALRWQDPKHRTLVIAPDNLLSQWQEECWIRGHVMPGIAGTIDESENEVAAITLARPRDLMIRPSLGTRIITADPSLFDLLIIDEPQTMPRDIVQLLSQAADDFRQVLVLSATPRLGDPSWRELILRMIEPQASLLARLEGRTLDEILEEREANAIKISGKEDSDTRSAATFSCAASGRRVIRNGREDWSSFLPLRKNHVIRIQPLLPERLRHEIASTLLENVDPDQELQGPQWTAARALQRSARAARTVLADLASRKDSLGERAEQARLASLEDPGDSRLNALLDILSNQWSQYPIRTFILVCGDNPTIDMLRTALPRYFPDLVDAISVLRRPAAAEADGVTNLREIQETLAPLLAGKNRILLVGDWVQAGLNLHHIAHGIIFFSIPWEIDSIDQLIGRIDRLSTANDHIKSGRTIDIWRILLEGSQETAIADVVDALGVFNAPLPPLSPAELLQVNATLSRAAIGHHVLGNILPLASKGTGLPTRLAGNDPYTPDRAALDFKVWSALPCAEPTIMTTRPRQTDTPVRKEECALNGWLKIIGKSADFDIARRSDKVDDYKFHTIWYHGVGAKGQAGESPFGLPGVARDRWMSDHVPFIYRRSDIASPPRKTVVTDQGEETARPLHFLDHGNLIHDAIVDGYANAALAPYTSQSPVAQTSVLLPEGHAAHSLGPTILLTVAPLDPFPGEMLPQLWSREAKAILASATTNAQRNALTADRRALQALYRAIQRRIRLEVPARLLRIGNAKRKDGWTKLSSEEVNLCLQPITESTNSAIAKGRNPLSPLLKPELANTARSSQLKQVEAETYRFQNDVLEHARPALEILISQVFDHFRAEIKNRELALTRRRESPPEGGLIELWQGQVAALERLLDMARLNNIEALAMLQEYASGRKTIPMPSPHTILISFANEF